MSSGRKTIIDDIIEDKGGQIHFAECYQSDA